MKHFRPFILEALTLALLALLLPSCMHMGMTTMHDGSDRQSKPGSILEKEVIGGDVKAFVVLPAMEVEREEMITLKLLDAKTSQPLSGAKVRFSVRHRDDSESHGSVGGEEMEESGAVYNVSYKATHAGEQNFTFVVTAIGERNLELPMTIEAKQTAALHQEEHGGGMMGMSGTSTYVIIGAVVMGAVMLAMIVAGGGMR